MPKFPRPFDLNAFSAPFRQESDRACAVLGAALIDERLKQLFDRRLHYSNDALLSHSGVLGSFSSRISVARALSWITDDVRFDLDQVRDIRNKFAHNADHELSFDDQSIADKCRNLTVAQTLLNANEALATSPPTRFSPEVVRAMASVFQSPRRRFEITIEMLAQHLDDLGPTKPEYSGPILREELWALGMTEPTVRIQATVTPLTASESDSTTSSLQPRARPNDA
jgi:DNA-binding MltR family transcriptional regulator